MKHSTLRRDGDSKDAAQRAQASQAGRPLAYMSHGARFERMVGRYAIARSEGRLQAAAAIKRAANRIVDEMPI